MTGGPIVQVVSKGGGEPQAASKLVWWLAGIAGNWQGHERPILGDIVVETTHTCGLARHRLGLISAVGELIAIEESKEGGTTYTIKTLEGKEAKWVNCRLAVIERHE